MSEKRHIVYGFPPKTVEQKYRWWRNVGTNNWEHLARFSKLSNLVFF